MKSLGIGSSKGQTNKPSKNFLETLKQEESSPKAGLGSFSAMEFGRFADKQEQLTKAYNQELAPRIESVQKQEFEVWSKEKHQVRAEIEALRKEIKLLAHSLNDFQGEAKEAEKAIETEVVDPGVYHRSFFIRIRNFISQLRKKINEANLWLETWNQRKKKKGFFWNTAFSKKGGAKFMLSSEHYVSRSAG